MPEPATPPAHTPLPLGSAPGAATLVVPTARLAAALRRDHVRRQRASGLSVWPAADFIGLGAWLVRASLAARSTGALPSFALLGHEQAQALWTQVIADGAWADELRPAQADSLARLMADADDTVFAWGLAGAWSAPLPLSGEQAMARGWRHEFRRRCAGLGVGTRTMLLEASVAAGLDLRGTAVSRGFDEAGPVLRTLLPTADAAPERAAARPRYRVFVNADEELDAALEWAFAARADRVGGSVALVYADARGVDALLARAARWQALSPDLAVLGAPAVLSAPPARRGTSALIGHALLALQLAGRVAVPDAIGWLTSPFFHGANAEFAPRHRLAARLQAERTAPFSFDDLWRAAVEVGCQGFAALVARLQSFTRDPRRRQPMAAWVELCQQWLNALGWPGEAVLSQQEQAALEAWQHALDTAAALDAVLLPQTAFEALARLRQIARGISDAELVAPDAIEILSVEEAAVLRPARAWVLGLHDAAWPLAPPSNPLLPQMLLRRAGAPGSDFAADAVRARRALSRVLAAADTVVLSYAAHDGETPRRSCGGLDWADADLRREAALKLAPSLLERWGSVSATVEAVPADPPVPLAPGTAPRGGTSILAAQAACAFQAFARFRLGAEVLEEALPGLDPRLRGEIAHDVMARLWTDLRSQAAARALSDTARADAVTAAIDAALDAALIQPQFSGRPRALEASRLQKLVSDALAQELTQREPFEVLAVEAQHELALGGLRLKLRIDRIDRLDSGARFIIDYKTGRAVRKEWELPRPLAPQLPAYALALDEQPLAGIAISQLRPGDCKLVTEPRKLAGDEAGFAAVAALREAWRAELTALARQFVAGDATLNPRDHEKTCLRCDFQLLCRVHEVPRAPAEEDVPDES